MKKRIIILTITLLVTLPLIAIALRSRGYLYFPADIQSVSPNNQHTARLFQLHRMIDFNYRITVRDSGSNQLVAEYTTPDESPLDDSVRFIWSPDATAVLLAGAEFYFDKDLEPSACVPDAYLLIDLTGTPASMYTAASQNNKLPALTNEVLETYGFCPDP